MPVIDSRISSDSFVYDSSYGSSYRSSVQLFDGRGFELNSDVCKDFRLTFTPLELDSFPSSGQCRLELPHATLTFEFGTTVYKVTAKLNIYKKIGDNYQQTRDAQQTISNISRRTQFSIISTSGNIQFIVGSSVKGSITLNAGEGEIVRNRDTFICRVISSASTSTGKDVEFQVGFSCEILKQFDVSCTGCRATSTKAYPYDPINVTSQHGSLHKAWSIEGLQDNCYIDQPPSDADTTFSFYMPTHPVNIVAEAFQPFKPSIDVINSIIGIRTLIEDDSCTSISLDVGSGELRAKSFYEGAGAIEVNCGNYSVHAGEFIESEE